LVLFRIWRVFSPLPHQTQLVCGFLHRLRVPHYEHYEKAIQASCSSTSLPSEGREGRGFGPSLWRPLATALATMASTFRDSAILVLPKRSQEPLRVPNAEDFVAVVWNGGCSFFVATAGSFSPSHNMFYFVLRVSHTLERTWYVWAPVRYQDRIRVSETPNCPVARHLMHPSRSMVK